ncbi:MAG: hypothetical protein Q9P14_15965 [candidate division KSB1 bacterium]|nr:hypothetical protein [candidate division KSB1 bacterium]
MFIAEGIDLQLRDLPVQFPVFGFSGFDHQKRDAVVLPALNQHLEDCIGLARAGHAGHQGVFD